MNILFFDTETTGIPADYRAPVTDTDNWPRLVQLAFCTYVDDRHVNTEDCIIKPNGFEIPAEASAIHGITTERALAEGVELCPIMKLFSVLVQEADLIVGHNISFDRKIIGAEFIRCGIEDFLHGKPRVCTMMTSTSYCQIPSPRGWGYKWPKLQELHKTLFGYEFDGAHDAKADIVATAKCYFELVKRGVIANG